MNQLFDEEVISNINWSLNEIRSEIEGHEKRYSEFYDNSLNEIREHVQKLVSIEEELENKVIEIRKVTRLED